MADEPGPKLDFGNIISYLLPGYAVALFIIAAGDLVNIIYHHFYLHRDIIPTVIRLRSLNTAQATLLALSSLLAAYFFGVIFDMWSHTKTKTREDNAKSEAYKDAKKKFSRMKNTIKELDILFDDELTPDGQQEHFQLIIDALFIRAATPEAWARHNWSWSFYEAARQFSFLTNGWISGVIALYCSLVLGGILTDSFDPKNPFLSIATLIISTLFAVAFTVFNVVILHKAIKSYRDVMCKYHYTYKANFVLGHMIQKGLLDKQQVQISPMNEFLLQLTGAESPSPVANPEWKIRAEKARGKSRARLTRDNR